MERNKKIIIIWLSSYFILLIFLIYLVAVVLLPFNTNNMLISLVILFLYGMVGGRLITRKLSSK